MAKAKTIKSIYRNGRVLLKGEPKAAATAKAKIENYSPELTAKVKDLYVKGEPVEKIAEMAGKTIRSIIAKLSKEGIYKPKTYTTKQGEKPQKKDATAEAIGAVLRLSEGEIDSLTKANKTALVKIFAALANSRPIEPDEVPMPGTEA